MALMARSGHALGVLLESLHAPRDVARLHQISKVFMRHGLGEVLQRLGVISALRRAGTALKVERMAELEELSTPERLVRVLEELGPTFVKLGQILAGRSDMLPPEWIQALERLQEHVADGDGESALAQLREDLGGDPSEIFSSFESEPIACGSIALVYAAELPSATQGVDARPVVLKVRRPGIVSAVEADLTWLARFADWLERSGSELARYRPRALSRQLARSLRAELDLREEARHLGRLRSALAGEPEIVLPRVIERYSGERLLVMQRFMGPSLGSWLVGEDVDRALARHLARVGADAILHLVFRVGFYHADPHPGNVILLQDGRMGLIDAGMVGRLSERRRREVLELIAAAAQGRVDLATSVLATWSAALDVDLDGLETDVRAFVERYHDLPLAELDVGAMLRDVQDVLRDNDLILPEDVAMLLKVFVTLDGLGRRLDPDFVMATRLEPILRDLLGELHSPQALLGRAWSAGRGALAELPRDLALLRRVLRRGRLPIEVDLNDLERFSQALARGSDRLTLGIVTSALIVGTAIALDAGTGPRALGVNAFALLGFVSSTLLGLVLIWNRRR